jgi:hypothetical protein
MHVQPRAQEIIQEWPDVPNTDDKVPTSVTSKPFACPHRSALMTVALALIIVPSNTTMATCPLDRTGGDSRSTRKR